LKKWIVIGAIAAVLLAIILVIVFWDSSGMISEVYRSQGLTVSEETVEHEHVYSMLDLNGVQGEQIEKISESYKIMYIYHPDNEDAMRRAVMIVCPTAIEAEAFLKSCGDEVYNRTKESGAIQGNCILFAYNHQFKEIFRNYFFEFAFSKIAG